MNQSLISGPVARRAKPPQHAQNPPVTTGAKPRPREPQTLKPQSFHQGEWHRRVHIKGLPDWSKAANECLVKGLLEGLTSHMAVAPPEELAATAVNVVTHANANGHIFQVAEVDFATEHIWPVKVSRVTRTGLRGSLATDPPISRANITADQRWVREALRADGARIAAETSLWREVSRYPMDVTPFFRLPHEMGAEECLELIRQSIAALIGNRFGVELIGEAGHHAFGRFHSPVTASRAFEAATEYKRDNLGVSIVWNREHRFYPGSWLGFAVNKISRDWASEQTVWPRGFLDAAVAGAVQAAG